MKKNKTYVLSIPYYDRIREEVGCFDAVVRAPDWDEASRKVDDLLGGDGIAPIIKLFIKVGLIDEMPELQGVTDEDDLLTGYELEIGEYGLYPAAGIQSLEKALQAAA